MIHFTFGWNTQMSSALKIKSQNCLPYETDHELKTKQLQESDPKLHKTMKHAVDQWACRHSSTKKETWHRSQQTRSTDHEIELKRKMRKGSDAAYMKKDAAKTRPPKIRVKASVGYHSSEIGLVIGFGACWESENLKQLNLLLVDTP